MKWKQCVNPRFYSYGQGRKKVIVGPDLYGYRAYWAEQGAVHGLIGFVFESLEAAQAAAIAARESKK